MPDMNDTLLDTICFGKAFHILNQQCDELQRLASCSQRGEHHRI